MTPTQIQELSQQLAEILATSPDKTYCQRGVNEIRLVLLEHLPAILSRYSEPQSEALAETSRGLSELKIIWQRIIGNPPRILNDAEHDLDDEIDGLIERLARYSESAPTQEPRWKRQELCSECDGDGCKVCAVANCSRCPVGCDCGHCADIPHTASVNKPTLPVGVSVLLIKDGKVLLGERINNTAAGLLSTPGGRIEAKESMFECATREAKEETGIELMPGLEVVGYREHFRFGSHYFMFYLVSRQWAGEIQNLEPDKCKSWDWYAIEDIRGGCTEPRDILERALGLDVAQQECRATTAELKLQTFHAEMVENKILADAQRYGMVTAPCGHAQKYETFGVPGAIGCVLCERDSAEADNLKIRAVNTAMKARCFEIERYTILKCAKAICCTCANGEIPTQIGNRYFHYKEPALECRASPLWKLIEAIQQTAKECNPKACNSEYGGVKE